MERVRLQTLLSVASLCLLGACEGETIIVGASPGATPPAGGPATEVAAPAPEAEVVVGCPSVVRYDAVAQLAPCKLV